MRDRPGEDRISALGYVLESERMRRFARQPGKAGYRTAKSWIKRVAVLVILPVTGLLMVVVGAVEIGPAYAAAHGHGTLGYFTAVSKGDCVRGTYCTWTGTFASLNLRDVRNNVRMDGSWIHVKAGTMIPALDSGDPFVVFPRHGSTRWHEDVSFLAIGAIILMPWLYLVAVRRMWRSRWRAVLALRRRGLPQ
jgi:hypothetical protein